MNLEIFLPYREAHLNMFKHGLTDYLRFMLKKDSMICLSISACIRVGTGIAISFDVYCLH